MVNRPVCRGIKALCDPSKLALKAKSTCGLCLDMTCSTQMDKNRAVLKRDNNPTVALSSLTNNPSKLHSNFEPYSGVHNGVHNQPTFIRLSATNPADRGTNVAQNVHNVDMDKKGALFGLCCDQFGPKPLCFWTGYSPRVPLKATSHTFHNPIHGNKYVQSCNLEWLLICQISCCQSMGLKAGIGTDTHR